ncbi:MAG: ribosome hibernation promoting factor [Pseudomonadota bacterium]
MQVNLTGRHMDITDSIRNYVTSKFTKLERHFDNVTRVNVILSVEKQRQMAEANFHVSGQDIYADTENEDMYAAIDGLIDKLDRQLMKYKEKLQNHR